METITDVLVVLANSTTSNRVRFIDMMLAVLHPFKSSAVPVQGISSLIDLFKIRSLNVKIIENVESVLFAVTSDSRTLKNILLNFKSQITIGALDLIFCSDLRIFIVTE